MSIKKVITKVKVPCIFYTEGSDIGHCKECSFFNGTQTNKQGKITAVDCLRSEIPGITAHITEFIMNDPVNNAYITYRLKTYDESVDGPLSDNKTECDICSFNKTLVNDRNVCLLRCGVSDDMIDPFMCHDGEYWEKVKSESRS